MQSLLLVVKWNLQQKENIFKEISLCIWEHLSWQNFTLNMGGLYKSGRCLFGIVHFCKNTPQIWKKVLYIVSGNTIEALPGHLGPPSYGENIVSFLMWRQRSGPKLVIFSKCEALQEAASKHKKSPWFEGLGPLCQRDWKQTYNLHMMQKWGL
jgi:hypothetical protein